MSKSITLYSHATGPNPWKVAIILEELGVPYEHKYLDMQTEMKAKPYTDLNPNGRVPAIEDPNTGINLWESGAIIEYLVETYDKDNKISFKNAPEKYLTMQWLHFQISGQGPYFGQAAWFAKFHPERIESATERYKNEIMRVQGVLNHALQGKEYLVGEKCTYADLAFVPWETMLPFVFGEDERVQQMKKDNPNQSAWMERLMSRPTVKKVMAEKMKASGH